MTNNKNEKNDKKNKNEINKEILLNKHEITTEEDQIKLTEEQENVYNNLIEFIKSDKLRELLLIGYAGTGKTTLIAKFINDLIKTKLCKKIVMVAPTHKAVNIAKSKLFSNKKDAEELEKIINIMTIHRLLNYQSYVGQLGEKFFAKGKIDPNWSIYDLVVVDECSMLSNQIIADIKVQLEHQSNPNIKIIYVGDPAQLPPVNQAESKIFNSSMKSLVLDKIIRTSNQKIMDLSNSHRNWIFSKKMSDVPHVGEFESESIHLFSTESKETKKWLDEFVNILKSNGKKTISEFDEGLDNLSNGSDGSDNLSLGCKLIELDHNKMIDNHNNNIILTWTNKKSNLYNQYVREKIFGKKDLAQYEIGEILIFNDFHRKEIILEETNNLDPDEKSKKIDFISFYTSEQIKLVGLKQITWKLKELKFKTNNNLSLEINDKFKKYYKKINKLFDSELKVYEMSVQKIIDFMEDKTVIPVYNIMSLHPDSDIKYNEINEEIEKIITKLKSSCYEIINKSKEKDNLKKCDIQSEVEKKINKLYKEYQSNVIDCFAQLNYGYCITVHKSQGSTFKNVFIDMNDILDNNNQNETSKCLYTSITRSSNTLNLLI
jgi:DNA polymerase III delta prime subunit